MKARYVRSVKHRSAHLTSAVWGYLPAPAQAALAWTVRFGSNHRRSLALPIILVVHGAMLLWFSSLPPRAIATYPTVMDVMLFPGAGLESAITAVPVPATSPVEEASPPMQPLNEAVERAEPPVDAPAEVPEADTPVESSTEAEPPPDLPDDVLAMVEAMAGATSAELAQPVAVMQTVTQATAWMPAQPGSTGGGCGIEDAIKARMIAEPAIQSALAAVPRDSRSVANAIQLWDGAWIPALAPEGELALVAVRAAIAEVIAEAPTRCRDQDILGPRFLIVAEPGGSTTVLVLGSGLWRWSDLVPTPKPALFRWFGFSQR